jgi:hypothetical protein
MSYHYLPALAGDCLDPPCSDGVPSAPWKKSRTAGRCCSEGSGTACFPCSLSGTTSRPSTDPDGVARWISSLPDSPASLSVSREEETERQTKGTCGRRPSGSFAKWSPAAACWKTSQASLLTGTLEPFSGSWPRAGIVSGGIAFQRQPLVPLTKGIASGLLPTPSATPYGTSQNEGKVPHKRPSRGTPSLDTMARKNLWPTPTVGDSKSAGGRCLPGSKAHPGTTLFEAVVHGGPKIPPTWPTPKVARWAEDSQCAGTRKGKADTLYAQICKTKNDRPGQLNPDWVEWLMGWPIGWTALEPLAMDRYPRWWRLHGCS